MPCNVEVNLITRLGVIALFSSFFKGQVRYLLVERNEMEKLYRGPYIDAYCQVWFHLAKLFQRRKLKYEKVNGLTTDTKTIRVLMKTHVTLQVALTEADIFQNLTISIFLGTVEANFIQIMCEKRDRSTPKVSVFGSENNAYPEIMGSLLICISKMAVSSSQKFLQKFLKDKFCSGVRAFFLR
jgi:hypothetical protein